MNLIDEIIKHKSHILGEGSELLFDRNLLTDTWNGIGAMDRINAVEEWFLLVVLIDETKCCDFAIYLGNHIVRLLSEIAPSLLLQLEKITFLKQNLTWPALIPKNTAHLADCFENYDPPIAIAYNDRRDSRSQAQQQRLHSNQQKVRDLFLAYLRVPKYPQNITARLHDENCIWFADLLIEHYLQDTRSKMEKLEERLMRSNNSVFQFLRQSDSHRLMVATKKRLEITIESIQDLICSGRRGSILQDIQKLCKLVKLLAALNYQFGITVSELDTEWLEKQCEEAATQQYLIVFLPWLQSYLSQADYFELEILKRLSPKIYSSERFCVALLVQQLFPEKNKVKKLDPFAVDADASVDVEKYLELFWDRWKDFTQRLFSNSAVQAAKPIRKICPVTQVNSKQLVREKNLQKKMRQWFWWQWPQLHDLVSAIGTYMEKEEDIKERLGIVIPLLLPPILKNNERIEKVMIALILEQVQKEAN